MEGIGEDLFNINTIIAELEKAAKENDNEATKFRNKGMFALAAWKRKEALKNQQNAEWLKELDKRRLRESLDD